MALDDLKNRLRGVIGFPVTPFRADLTLDLYALERNVDIMSGYPFCALVAAGGTGELYSLTPDETVEVVRNTVKAARGRMPVIAGVGFNTPIAVDLARRVQQAGAAAILAMPPYYTNSPASGLLAYYAAIGAASALPMIIYSRDWAVFTPEQVLRLAEAIPTLAGWKDGQGDVRRLHRIMCRVGERLAWLGGVGDDCAAAYFAIGCQAYTSSISNIAPALSIAIGRAGLGGNFEQLEELIARYVQPLYALRERGRGYEVAVMKHAMELLGLTAGPVRPPLQNCTPAELQDIGALMDVYRASPYALRNTGEAKAV